MFRRRFTLLYVAFFKQFVTFHHFYLFFFYLFVFHIKRSQGSPLASFLYKFNVFQNGFDDFVLILLHFLNEFQFLFAPK